MRLEIPVLSVSPNNGPCGTFLNGLDLKVNLGHTIAHPYTQNNMIIANISLMNFMFFTKYFLQNYKIYLFYQRDYDYLI